MPGKEVWSGFTSRTFEFKPKSPLNLNLNDVRMSFCDICQYICYPSMTPEEGEFQGGAIRSEELPASLACRDEATDLGPVLIAPLLTTVYEQTLEVLAFLGCHNSVAAKFMFALFFSLHSDLLGWAFLSAKPTFHCSSSMKGITGNWRELCVCQGTFHSQKDGEGRIATSHGILFSVMDSKEKLVVMVLKQCIKLADKCKLEMLLGNYLTSNRKQK